MGQKDAGTGGFWDNFTQACADRYASVVSAWVEHEKRYMHIPGSPRLAADGTVTVQRDGNRGQARRLDRAAEAEMALGPIVSAGNGDMEYDALCG